MTVGPPGPCQWVCLSLECKLLEPWPLCHCFCSAGQHAAAAARWASSCNNCPSWLEGELAKSKLSVAKTNTWPDAGQRAMWLPHSCFINLENGREREGRVFAANCVCDCCSPKSLLHPLHYQKLEHSTKSTESPGHRTPGPAKVRAGLAQRSVLPCGRSANVLSPNSCQIFLANT